jgi:two-component system, response regulator
MEYKSEIDILLIEDNPNDAELTILALREANIKNSLLCLKDGAEALEFLFSKGRYSEKPTNFLPKVVILDLNLPKISGLIVLGKIRKDPLTEHIPVVILTSSSIEKDVIEAYNLGVNSYIVKPIEFDEFVESVKGIGLYWLLLNESPLNN